MSGTRSTDSSTFVGSLDGVINPPTSGDSRPVTVEVATSSTSARYALRDEIARGGLGVVRRAWDQALDREVAVKSLLEPSPGGLARFDRETRITARLQHPNIVPVHDGGRAPDGSPFLAMRLVNGRSLADAIGERPTLAERMRLLPHVIDACNAVAYAHGERVAHRDLKPDNILVGDFGETVVIDWGLAKELDDEHSEEIPKDAWTAMPPPTRSGRSLTRVGAVMGTPAYMPPEQAAGRRVDERSDVYALGAVLYHTLAGVRPYAGCEDTLSAVLVGPPRTLAGLTPDVPRDLLAVVSKAMSREPGDRYADARSLAAELERFQAGAFVSAHQYTTGERVRRIVRQNPLPTALIALLLAGSLIGVALLWRAGAVAENRRAEAEAARAEAMVLQATERVRLDDVTLDQARLMLDIDPGESLSLLASLSEDRPFDAEVRNVAAAAFAEDPPVHLPGQRAEARPPGLEWTPDGLFVCGERSLSWFDGSLRAISEHRLATPSRSCMPRPGGGFLMATEGGVQFVDPDGSLHTRSVPGAVTAVGVGPHGWVAYGNDNGSITLEANGRVHQLDGMSYTHATRFASDGVLITLSNAQLRAFEPEAGRALGEVELSAAGYGVFPSPWAPEVVVVGASEHVDLVTWNDGLRTRAMPTGGSWFDQAVWVSSDVVLLGGAGDRVVELNVRSGATRDSAPTDGAPGAFALGPDGQVAIGTLSGAIALVHWPGGAYTRLARSGEPVARLAWSPDGRWLAASRRSGVEVRSPRARDGAVVIRSEGVGYSLSARPDGALGVTWSDRALSMQPDGTTLALEIDRPGGILWCNDRWWVSGLSGELRAFESGGALERSIALPGKARKLVCSPDAEHIGADLINVGAAIVRTADGHVSTFTEEAGFLHEVAFHPDGRVLVAGGDVLELADPDAEPVPIAPVPVDAPHVAWWRDEPLIAGFDGRLLHGRGEAARALEPRIGLPTGVAVLEDGRLFLTDSEGSVWMWGDPAASTNVGRLHQQYIHALAVHPSGRWVATGGWDDLVVLWDVSHPALPGRILRGHRDAVMALAWSGDGQTLYAIDRSGDVRAWTDPLATEPEALRRQVRALADALAAGRPPPTLTELDALASR